jgi:hypothetical protein
VNIYNNTKKKVVKQFMAEGIMHKKLKKQALFYLKNKVTDIVAQEVKFTNIRCIADVVGINLKRKEIRVVEAKSTREDFFRDKSLFCPNSSYLHHAHYVYLITPKGLIKKEEVPREVGLIWWSEENGTEVKQKPIKNKNKLKTRFETTLKRTTRRLTNELLYGSVKMFGNE